MFGDFNIGWDYAWWFPAVYLVVTAVIMVIYGKGFTRKFLRFPGAMFKGKIPTILSSTLFSRGILAYAIFLPLETGSAWLWIGLVFFSISTVLYGISVINFARTPLDEPVIRGMYRISRHPVQVLAIIMSVGIGIATLSWIIIIASVLLAIVSYPTFLVQERSCLEMYGSTYHKYMQRTPRWLGIPKEGS